VTITKAKNAPTMDPIEAVINANFIETINE
jgi:hypothetical protein